MKKNLNPILGILISMQLAVGPVASATVNYGPPGPKVTITPVVNSAAPSAATSAAPATGQADAGASNGGNVGESPAEKKGFFSKVLEWTKNFVKGTGNNETLNQAHQDWVKNNRSLGERANPFKDPSTFKNEDEVQRFLDENSPNRYIYTTDKATNVVTVYDMTKQQDPIVGMFQMSTPQELQEFSPSRMKEKLMSTAKAVGKAGAGGVQHTVVSMRMEAAVFYTAMGAVSAFYMFNNFGANPAALQLNNDQQLSVLGGTSLFMFLASQNATSNIAQLAIKNKSWHVLLPYLGMTVGTMVQNYWVGLWTDPNVKACVKEWFGNVTKVDGAYEDPCEKAYEYFTAQKPWEFAPGLTSMMFTTAALAGAQSVAAKGVLRAEKAITEKVISSTVRRELAKKILIRVAGFINPASTPYLAATGLWLFLTKFSNLALFAGIDHKVSQTISFAVKNLQEGVSLPFLKTIQRTSDQLTQHIAYQKENGWNVRPTEKACAENKHADCSGFYEEINRFTDQMKSWRMSNAAEVMESQASWQTYLGKLVTNYNTSKEFYKYFIEQARVLVNLGEDPDDKKLLTRYYPFWGVQTTGTKEIDSTFFTDPHLPESEQFEFVQKFQRDMLAWVQSKQKNAANLHDSDKKFLETINKYFLNNKGDTPEAKLRLGFGIDAARRYAQQKFISGEQFQNMYTEVSKLLEQIPKASPKLYRGQGMIAAMERIPQIANGYKDLDVPWSHTMIRYRTMSDFYLMSMLCGPDIEKGEPMISSLWGFPAKFTPPSIANTRADLSKADTICSGFGTGNADLLYNYPVVGPYRWSKTQTRATYNGPFDYLKFNLKPSLLGDAKEKPFDNWWKSRTEAQMTASFNQFQELYKQNIAKLLEKLHQREISRWNLRGTAANGLMLNIFQELRVNLLILGEILKDSYALKTGRTLPEKYLAANALPAYALKNNLDSDIPEMLRAQIYGSYLDYDSLVKNYPKFGYRPKVQNSGGTVLKIQKDIELTFARMNGFLRQIQAVKKGEDQYEIHGKVNNFDIQKLAEDVEKLTENFSKMLGVFKAPQNSADVFKDAVGGGPAAQASPGAGPAQTRTETLGLSLPDLPSLPPLPSSSASAEAVAPTATVTGTAAANEIAKPMPMPSIADDGDADQEGDVSNPALMVAEDTQTRGANAASLAKNASNEEDDQPPVPPTGQSSATTPAVTNSAAGTAGTASNATAGAATTSATGAAAAPVVPEIEKLVDLNPGSKAIAVKCLENIQALAYEVMSYGMIINAVSWENLQRVKEMSEAQQSQQQKIQQMLETAKAKKTSIGSQ
jgi:hypothetical protein